jgi:hypothetical protein
VTHQPDDLVDGLATLFEDTELRHRLATAAREFCHDQSYARMAQRHRALWQTLEST